MVATGEASAASATRGKRRQHGFRPGGAEVGCHGWSERSERNPWKASPTWIPPRRGGGLLPRVKRAKRAQPVEGGINMETAPEGRRRHPARLAPPLRLAHPALPPPLRGGSTIRATFHGLRCASGSAPPVATTRRPSGATKVACQ